MVSKSYESWFTFSTEGFRVLQSSRPKADVAKELVSNGFDADANVVVLVRVVDDGVMMDVQDDGEGFSNVSFAWDVMAANYEKRGNPEVRGRFNLGEKEIVSLCTWAKIMTVGTTVMFQEDGTREVVENGRKSGTHVQLLLPWKKRDAAEVVDGLSGIIPPEHLSYSVNGRIIFRPKVLVGWEASLTTVLQEGPDQPLRERRRKVVMEIFQPLGKDAFLYEMGIPIQKIECFYSVNVQQKVPMPPNRDTVRESYLKRLYTEVLNATHGIMPEEEFAETWVRTGIEDKRVKKAAVDSVIEHRYGGADKVVFASSNRDSNMQALDAGKILIQGRQLSGAERERLRDVGGIKTSHQVFGRAVDMMLTVMPESVPGNAEFSRWVGDIGRAVGLRPTVSYVSDKNARMSACCTANTEKPIVTFNVGLLGEDWFFGRGEKQLRLIIHELGHAYGNGETGHGYTWGNSCAEIGARLALSGVMRDAEA